MSDERTLTEAASYTPHSIAFDLYGKDGADANAKRIRAYLRATVQRPIELKNSSWILDRDAAEAVFAHFAKAIVSGPNVTLNDLNA